MKKAPLILALVIGVFLSIKTIHAESVLQEQTQVAGNVGGTCAFITTPATYAQTFKATQTGLATGVDLKISDNGITATTTQSYGIYLVPSTNGTHPDNLLGAFGAHHLTDLPAFPSLATTTYNFDSPRQIYAGNYYSIVVDKGTITCGDITKPGTVINGSTGSVTDMTKAYTQDNGSTWVETNANAFWFKLLTGTIDESGANSILNNEVASTTLPFAKITFPESDDGSGTFFTLHSGVYKFKFQLYSPDAAYTFFLEGDQINHEFNNLTTSTFSFANEGLTLQTHTLPVINGQVTYYRATLQSDAEENKKYVLYFDVLGDDTKPITSQEQPTNNSNVQFTCAIPYIKWDPCDAITYMAQTIGNLITKKINNGANLVQDTKPIKYAFQIKDAIVAGMEEGSSTATTTLNYSLNYRGQNFELLNATSTPLKAADQNQWNKFRKYQRYGIYTLFGTYIIWTIL